MFIAKISREAWTTGYWNNKVTGYWDNKVTGYWDNKVTGYWGNKAGIIIRAVRRTAVRQL